MKKEKDFRTFKQIFIENNAASNLSIQIELLELKIKFSIIKAKTPLMDASKMNYFQKISISNQKKRKEMTKIWIKTEKSSTIAECSR